MQLHQLKSTYTRKKIKRVGRGGKRGTYSGRGQKGQKARAGHRIRPAARDTLLKIPKLRGIGHKSLKPNAIIINVGDFANKISDSTINRALLLKRGMIKKHSDRVKILGGGILRRAVIIEDIGASKGAREKIKAAGGTVK